MATQVVAPGVTAQIAEAKGLAPRYRTPYVDLKESVVDMMFRSNFVPVVMEKKAAGETMEIAEAKGLVPRYRTPYVDLKESAVDMMFRYNFVPVVMEIAVADTVGG